jgi:hypothetical protein
MSVRHHSKLLLLVIALLALAACGDDDPTGPAGDSGRSFDVNLTATTLDVQQDCDDFGGSASSAAGDFFIRVELRSVRGGTSTAIGSTDYALIQANDNQTVPVGFRAEGVFVAAAGARLEADVSIYENDSGGVRQFDETDTMTFEFDSDKDCWVYSGDTTCLGSGTSGNVTSSVMRVRELSGDPCSVDLNWTFGATER